MTVTLHFQSTGAVPGDAGPIQMSGLSLTIGRGTENDVVLPDPDRVLSKRHCAIEDHGGSLVVGKTGSVTTGRRHRSWASIRW